MVFIHRFLTRNMKRMNLFLIIPCLLSIMGCGGSADTDETSDVIQLVCTPAVLNIEAGGATAEIDVKANREWSVYSDEDWITSKPSSSINPEETVLVTIKENTSYKKREGSLVFRAGKKRETIVVTQKGVVVDAEHSPYVPAGYSIVWNDEFNTGCRPNTQNWYYETGANGWGNNELQEYVAGSKDGEDLAAISNGIFKIIAKKINNKVYSIRINSNESWTYGYFEARLKLPAGKGTWPAFWMMPKNFTSWPEDGEIDIMEEVGYRPNWVSSAIHTKAYNHKNNTQKTAELFLGTAQSDFHVYALQWTKDEIKSYVDGKCIFTFMNDGKQNRDTWPFNQPFYLKLNLAWGGDWGGAQGVDESALPAEFLIDYVRVYQVEK